tara:strand:- start:2182 stop:3576 length:1395 start_codon:yes stop_codon:yes gene_type:complete
MSDLVHNVNPSDTRDVIGSFEPCGAAQAHSAIARAREAFVHWRKSSPQERADILDAAGSRILAVRQALGEQLAREEGKTLAEAVGEVTRAGHIFKFFAGEALRVQGHSGGSVRPGVDVDVSVEPIGVFGLITPWNFPIAIPAWKLAPALAFGNCAVLKPSEFTPASAASLSRILSESGLPEGVLQVVDGIGSEAGAALVESPDVDGISFTGSQATGRGIAASCGQQLKRVQLEMGGKNPLLVCEDADIAVAVECAINGAFFSTGQRCTASSRLIVVDAIHDQFVARMTERIKALRVGHALEKGVEIGPVIHQAQLDKNQQWLQRAVSDGADLACGGELLKRETPGFYMSPALFVNTRNDMPVNTTEVFGPLASVIRVGDFEEGLALANDTAFGLCAGVCTQSLSRATHFRREAQAGLVMVNLPTAGIDYHVPFGGRRSSSFGPREQGDAARDFYTQGKTAYIRD